MSHKRENPPCRTCGAVRERFDRGALCLPCRREAKRARYRNDPRARALQLAASVANVIARKFPQVEVIITPHEYADLLLEVTACAYCGQPNDGVHVFALDHRVPLYMGGRHAVDNLEPCCEPCNRAKHKMSAEQFRAWLRGVAERGAQRAS